MLDAQSSECALCKVKIGRAGDVLAHGVQPFIAEHSIPVALGNEEKPDCLLCLGCATIKTKKDVTTIAKTKRQKLKHETGRSRKRKSKPFPKRVNQWPKRSFSSRQGSKSSADQDI